MKVILMTATYDGQQSWETYVSSSRPLQRGGMSKGNKTHKTNAHFSKFMIFIFKIFKIYFDEASAIPLKQKKILYDNGISWFPGI